MHLHKQTTEERSKRQGRGESKTLGNIVNYSELNQSKGREQMNQTVQESYTSSFAQRNKENVEQSSLPGSKKNFNNQSFGLGKSSTNRSKISHDASFAKQSSRRGESTFIDYESSDEDVEPFFDPKNWQIKMLSLLIMLIIVAESFESMLSLNYFKKDMLTVDDAIAENNLWLTEHYDYDKTSYDEPNHPSRNQAN
jgi:hypothetical protein